MGSTLRASPYVEPGPLPRTADPRWELVQRVAGSRQFAKAPLLSKFLTYVCDRTLKGKQAEISEHQIGVQVFGRQPGYSPSEDNIVRNYARQLRKRLAEHFATEGCDEPLRIEIPVGGYVPIFVRQGEEANSASAEDRKEMPFLAGESHAVAAPEERSWWSWRRIAYLVCYSLALAGVVAYLTERIETRKNISGSTHVLWAQLFNSGSDTFVVAADSGFGILQNLSKTRMPLAEYVTGKYATLPLPPMDVHNSADLYTQRYTSVVDLEVASTLSRLPEVVPGRLILRFARDLRMDDLKQGNAILIGSMYSNPWGEVFQHQLNFHFDYRPDMNDSWILNASPRAGEAKSYENNWDGPSHQTYAVIAFIPNLNRNGHVLLIQGLDMAATQAAAELLFHEDEIGPILKQASLPGGALRPFEVLLQTTSIGANAPSAAIVATRTYPQ
jgi:hypothetical protein